MHLWTYPCDGFIRVINYFMVKQFYIYKFNSHNLICILSSTCHDHKVLNYLLCSVWSLLFAGCLIRANYIHVLQVLGNSTIGSAWREAWKKQRIATNHWCSLFTKHGVELVKVLYYLLGLTKYWYKFSLNILQCQNFVNF